MNTADQASPDSAQNTTSTMSFTDTLQAIQALVNMIGGAEKLPELTNLVDKAGGLTGLSEMVEYASASKEDRTDVAKHLLRYFEYLKTSGVKEPGLAKITDFLNSGFLHNKPVKRIEGFVKGVVADAIHANQLIATLEKDRDEWKNQFEVLAVEVKTAMGIENST